MNILVTGANGQLGSCLQELEAHTKHKFIFTDIEQLDICSKESVDKFVTNEKIDWIINCAAYTAVDKAESDAELAMKLNCFAVENLAKASVKIGAGLIHISTDYVFNGEIPSPLTEEDEIDPQSVYGKTKAEGEKMAMKNPHHIIIRTSWLYSIYGNNFVKTMRRLGAEKSEIGVVADQWGTPTSAHDLAGAIMSAIDNPQYGIYHYSNEGATNWALFAEQIMELSGLRCKVNLITTDQYPTPAKRPQFSLMSKKKFCSTFGVVIPEWESSLEEVIHKLDK